MVIYERRPHGFRPTACSASRRRGRARPAVFVLLLGRRTLGSQRLVSGSTHQEHCVLLQALVAQALSPRMRRGGKRSAIACWRWQAVPGRLICAIFASAHALAPRCDAGDHRAYVSAGDVRIC